MKRLILATIFAAVTSTVLPAQSSVMKADIPFEFHAGKTVLPAGHYVIEDRTWWLLVRQVGEGNHSAMLMSQPVYSSGAAEKPHLTFNRYGDSYFLRKTSGGSSGVGRELPQTSIEKELAKNRSLRQEKAALLAHRE